MPAPPVVVDVTVLPPATVPASTAAPAPAAPAPVVSSPIGEVPLVDATIDTPILECDLWAALVAATADCDLAVLAALAPQLVSPVDTAPLIDIAADVVADVTTGIVDADAVADVDAVVGPTLDVAGDVCLDYPDRPDRRLSRPPPLAPPADASGGPDGPASLIDADVCAAVAVAAPLSAACLAPPGDPDGPVSLIDADVCATVAVIGLTPTPAPRPRC